MVRAWIMLALRSRLSCGRLAVSAAAGLRQGLLAGACHVSASDRSWPSSTLRAMALRTGMPKWTYSQFESVLRFKPFIFDFDKAVWGQVEERFEEHSVE